MLGFKVILLDFGVKSSVYLVMMSHVSVPVFYETNLVKEKAVEQKEPLVVIEGVCT